MGEMLMFLYLFTLMVTCEGCNGGTVYKVGGPSGWTNTNLDPLYYRSWSCSQTFHVGDILSFEYNKEFHNVVRVTRQNFNSCNSTSPYAIWATGNDSFTITSPGHYYFICSLPGHCWAGQRVDIRVAEYHRPRPGPSLSPQSPVSPGPSGPSPLSIRPAQHPKSGSSFLPLSWKLWSLAAAIGLQAVAF